MTPTTQIESVRTCSIDVGTTYGVLVYSGHCWGIGTVLLKNITHKTGLPQKRWCGGKRAGAVQEMKKYLIQEE